MQQIVQRYDIILLQEIRDATESVTYELINMLNRYGFPDCVCSIRVFAGNELRLGVKY